MSLLKRSTAEKLGQALAKLAEMAASIAELQRRRDAELDDIDAAMQLDRQADEQGRELRLLQGHIALLEHKLVDEQRDTERAKYVAAVAAIAGPVARRTEAAVALEKALADVGTAAKRFASCTAAVLSSGRNRCNFRRGPTLVTR